MKRNSKYIPLLVNLSEPLAVYIIDNQIIGFDEYYTDHQHPGKAFNILHKLNTHEITKKIIPTHLQQILESSVGKRRIPHYSLAGELDGGVEYCLFLTMRIDQEQEKPVHIDNFAIVHEYAPLEHLDVNPLGIAITLTSEEAFILFSNLCVTSLMYYFSRQIPTNEYTYEIFTKIIESQKAIVQEKKQPSIIYSQLKADIINYSLAYLQYLNQRINDSSITPQEILRLSGMKALSLLTFNPRIQSFYEVISEILKKNYSQFTAIEKIMYYSLLEIFYHNTRYKIQKVYDLLDNSELSIKIMKELKKELPGPIGNHIHIKDLHKSYFV